MLTAKDFETTSVKTGRLTAADFDNTKPKGRLTAADFDNEASNTGASSNPVPSNPSITQAQVDKVRNMGNSDLMKNLTQKVNSRSPILLPRWETVDVQKDIENNANAVKQGISDQEAYEKDLTTLQSTPAFKNASPNKRASMVEGLWKNHTAMDNPAYKAYDYNNAVQAQKAKGFSGNLWDRIGDAARSVNRADAPNVKADTGNGIVNTVADIGGSILGIFAPTAGTGGFTNSIGGAMGELGGAIESKLLSALSKNATSRIASKAISNAAATIPLSATQHAIAGESNKDILKNTALESLQMGVLGGASHGILDELIPSIASKLKSNKPLTEAETQVVKNNPTLIDQIRKELGITDEGFTRKANSVDDKLNPLLESIRKDNNITNKPDVFVKNKNASKMDALNGIIRPSSTTSNESILNDAKTAQNGVKGVTVKSGLKQNKFAITAQESPLSNGEFTNELQKDMPTYTPITNAATLAKAEKRVSENPGVEKDSFLSVGKGINADDVATGEVLIKNAIKSGNHEEAARLTADLAQKLTESGQAVQAAFIFKRMTPEGMLLYAQRQVNAINRDLEKNMGKAFKKVELTEEDRNIILDSMQKAQALPDGRAKDIEIGKVMKTIANKAPVTKSEKLLGVQRVSMLLNPKTMFRNVLGNVVFGTVDNLSNVVATPIDKLVGLATKNRTTTLPSITGQLKSMAKGAKETIEDAKLGIDTSMSKGQYELPSKRIFHSKAMNALDSATRVGLELGDRPFYRAAYDDSLRQQMKLNKVSEPTQEMIDRAHRTAQQRTYQDVNSLTNTFKSAQKAMNFNKQFGLGNVVLPFTKTPANILKRAIEYSPIGLEKAIRETMNIVRKTGKFDQKAFVDSLSRAATGTALIAVGYELAKKGIITGQADQNKVVAAFERALGKNEYSWKFGNKYFTYDWMQPSSMALAIGADMYSGGKSKKQVESAIVDAIKSGGTTLFKQSLLQGVQKMFGGYSPMDNLESTLTNAPSQFAPTALKQVAQMVDNNTRVTSTGTPTQQGINVFKSKIPVLSKSLQPKIDVFGNPVLNYQGKNNLFNIFMNPSTTTTYNPTAEQKEIMRLYNSTGSNDVFPKVAPKSLQYKGQTVQLTPKDYTAFQTTMGQLTMSKIKSILISKVYIKSNDEQKSKLIQKQIESAYEKTKEDLLRSKGLVK